MTAYPIRFQAMLVAVLVTAATTIAPFPQPATADDNCDSGEFCVWGDTNFGGDFWDPSTDDDDWPCGVFCSPDVDNNEDSVWNRESVIIEVYDGTNFDGKLMYCVDPGDSEDDIAGDRDNDGESNLTYDATGVTDCGSAPAP